MNTDNVGVTLRPGMIISCDLTFADYSWWSPKAQVLLIAVMQSATGIAFWGIAVDEDQGIHVLEGITQINGGKEPEGKVGRMMRLSRVIQYFSKETFLFLEDVVNKNRERFYELRPFEMVKRDTVSVPV